MSKAMTGQGSATHLQLRAAGTGVVLRLAEDELPQILHWGADLGPADDQQLAEFAANAQAALENSVDVPVHISVIPEHSSGWMGIPGSLLGQIRLNSEPGIKDFQGRHHIIGGIENIEEGASGPGQVHLQNKGQFHLHPGPRVVIPLHGAAGF